MKILIMLSRAKTIVVLTVAVMLGLSNKAKAQQEALYSQYMFNMMAVNPAYAGSRDVLSMTGLFRQQWVGVEGAPTTQSFTIDMPLKKEKVGLGLQAYNDKAGDISNTGVYLTYAYRVKVSEKATLAMGITGGVTNLRADIIGTKLTQDGDVAFSQNVSRFLPNVGTGLYLSTDRGYIGISCPALIQNTFGQVDTTKKQQGKQARHYFAMMGFVVGISNSLKLKPSLLVKASEASPLSFDGNINLWIKDRVALGASYRTTLKRDQTLSNGWTDRLGDAVIGMLELQVSDQLRFGYAYDFMVNGLQNKQNGSHEIMLRYEFGFKKAKILTPRYF